MWETCDTNPIGPCKRDARRASDTREARASLASRCHAKVMQVGRVPLHCFGFWAIRSVEMSCLAGEPTGANEMTCLPEWGARQRRLEFHRSLQVAVTIAPSLGEHCSARTFTNLPRTTFTVFKNPKPPEGRDASRSRKRDAPSTSDGSGSKRAKCEHGRQHSTRKECGGSGI